MRKRRKWKEGFSRPSISYSRIRFESITVALEPVPSRRSTGSSYPDACRDIIVLHITSQMGSAAYCPRFCRIYQILWRKARANVTACCISQPLLEKR